jgi:tetratricopeptide (TPR) repeat protein
MYRDFIVRAGPATDNKLRVEVTGLPPGKAPQRGEHEIVDYERALFRVPVGGREVDLLDEIKKREVPEDLLYSLGKILASLILPRTVRERFRNSLHTVVGLSLRLRLRLWLEEPDLKTLPWEYLYLPSAPDAPDHWSGFLALDQNVSIVRHEDLDLDEPPVPRGGKYRMVAALASPHREAKLDIDADRRAIERAIEGAAPSDVVTPTWLQPATRGALEGALKDPCDIFHFSGHGVFDAHNGKGQILLVDPKDGEADPYDAGDLSHLLRDAKTKIAILSACSTAGRITDNPWGGVAANLVRTGLAAVVASQYRLLDQSALALTETLYASLLSGQPIDHGIYEARKRMRLAPDGLEKRDWGSLVLYLRTPDGVIFPRAPAEEKVETGPRIAPTPLQMPLVGRSGQLTTLGKELGAGRNLFFHGSYGVGKTSLATELFGEAKSDRRFARGYVWGRLSRDTSPENAVEWLAAHFSGRQVAQAQGLAGKVEALRQILAGSAGALIALDDVRSAPVAQAILDASGPCAVLINGDLRLALSGTQAIEVKPLDPSDAESLFLSLTNINPSGGERHLVAEICRRMGRLPLGIKLAALKCAEGESLETLTDRLKAGGDVADDNVRLVFEASFEELRSSPEAQRLLLRIAAFPALEAPIAALRSGERGPEFFQAKDKLVALGLIGGAGPDRLAQHPLLPPLSREKAPADLVQREETWVGEWIAGYAKRHRADFAALHREHDNLLGLLNVRARDADQNRAVALLKDLFDYLRLRGLWQEASDRLDGCLLDPAGLSNSNRGWALMHRAIIRTLMSRFDDALRDLGRAEKIYDGDDHKTDLGRVRYRRGAIFMQRGTFDEAAAEFKAALELMDVAAAAADVAGARARLGAILAQQGNTDQALDEFAAALRLSESENAYEEQARVHIAMGALEERAGNRGEAFDHFRHSQLCATKVEDSLQAAQILREIGDQHYNSAQYAQASSQYLEAQKAFQGLGYRPGEARSLHALGNVALGQNDLDGARKSYSDALALNQSLGLAGAAGYNRYQLAVLNHRQGLLAVAEQGYLGAITDAKKAGDRVLEAAALAQLSKVSRQLNRRDAARRYAKDALVLAEQLTDRLTRAVALYQLAMVDAADGQLSDAKGRLAEAREAFAIFGGQELDQVKQASAGLDRLDLGSIGPDHSESFTVDEPVKPETGGPDRTLPGGPDRVLPGGDIQNTDEPHTDHLGPTGPDRILPGRDLVDRPSGPTPDHLGPGTGIIPIPDGPDRILNDVVPKKGWDDPFSAPDPFTGGPGLRGDESGGSDDGDPFSGGGGFGGGGRFGGGGTPMAPAR